MYYVLEFHFDRTTNDAQDYNTKKIVPAIGHGGRTDNWHTSSSKKLCRFRSGNFEFFVKGASASG